MIDSIIQPKRPTASGWQRATWWRPHPELAAMGYPVEAWENKAANLFVLSSLEVVADDDNDNIGPEYHISISAYGVRCTTADALWVIWQFGMEDAKEDNHVPNGNVRNWWRPVADRLSGFECKCVEDEPAIREDKGDFVWRGITK